MLYHPTGTFAQFCSPDAAFIFAKTWKNLRYRSTAEWIKNLVLLHNGVILSYKKIDMNFADKSIELCIIIVSDNHTQKYINTRD